MARKAEGIEYFPMNTGIINCPQVNLVVAELGSKISYPVILLLLCKIYRDNGYWIDWENLDDKLLFAQNECRMDIEEVERVVAACIKRSIFDKALFDKYGILTSETIQDNYFTVRARSKSVDFYEEFSINDVYKSFKNVNITGLNENILTKVVYIKPGKSKINEEEEWLKKYTVEEVTGFRNFRTFISTAAGNVGKMKDPFMIDQYVKLKKDYTAAQIKEMILKMHNYKPLLTKNNSAYLTFINWSKKDYNGGDQPGATNKPDLSAAVKAIENGSKPE